MDRLSSTIDFLIPWFLCRFPTFAISVGLFIGVLLLRYHFIEHRPSRHLVRWGVTLVALILVCPIMNTAYNEDVVLRLWYAARDGNWYRVKTLLDAGADVNYETIDYGTPLTIAAYNNDAPMVRLLIQHGADVNKKVAMWQDNMKPETPLDVAQGHPQIIAILKQAGARE